MRKFVVLNLEQLGPNGMSSNESDHEVGNREPVYFILTKPWRDKSVTAWLRVLDALHLHERYRWEFTATPRSWPHFRHPPYRTDNTCTVPSLPINFYACDWYKSLNNFQMQELLALQNPVILTHEKDVLL